MNKRNFLLVIVFLALGLTCQIYAQSNPKNEVPSTQIAIVPFLNTSTNSWLSTGLEYLIFNKIAATKTLHLTDRVLLNRTLYDLAVETGFLNDRNSYQIGKSTGANITVSGSVAGNKNDFTIEVRMHNSTNGEELYNDKMITPPEEIANVADKIVFELLSLAGAVSERELVKKTVLTNNFTAFRNFILGYKAINQENPQNEQAILSFEEAIAEDPQFWEARYNLGVVYFNSNQYKKALAIFDNLITEVPNFYKSYYGRGLIFEQQLKLSDAITNFKKVIDLNPNDYKAFYYLGKISLAQNNISLAENYLTKAEEINADYAPVHFEQANLLIAKDQIGEAIEKYRMALELDPENEDYRLKLGETHYRMRVYYKALSEFNHILDKNPNHAEANFMLGVTIYKQGVLEQIVDAFLDLLDSEYGLPLIDDKKVTRKIVVDQEKQQKVYNAMVVAFKKATENQTDFIQALFNLSLTYLEMGNYADAETYFLKTLTIDPDLIPAYIKLAEVYVKMGDRQKSIEQYKKAFYLTPALFVNQPTLGPEHQYIDVLTIFLNDLSNKLKMDPNDEVANLTLAKVYIAQGNNGKATEVLKRVLQINPGQQEAKLLLSQFNG